MKKFFAAALIFSLCSAPSFAQANQSQPARQTQPTPATQQPRPPQAPPRSSTLNLDEYGVSLAAEPRLVAVMAALEAAGFDPAPGRPPSLFRARVRQDQATLDEDLRARLRRFYELHRLKDAGASPAREAARYVSLAFALGPPPAFEAPARGDETYEAVADVLDFAPLVREFHRSWLEGRLPSYVAEYRAEGDRMRRPTSEMVRSVLNYLHTRPITTVLERTARPAASDDRKKKDERPSVTTRERDRRFVVVPDLLGVPGALNFRVIRDDYFVVVPAGLDPSTPEVRRAYLQYVIDPLVLRYNRDIALKRADVRALLDGLGRAAPAANERGEVDASRPPLPDVFTAVARSLVAAADARMTVASRLEQLSADARAELQKTPEGERAALTQRVQARRAEIEEDMAAELAAAYERGAVLAFHFADQLRDLEAAGFDFADFIPGMIERADVLREKRRPAEYAEARARSEARARARREAARSAPADEREAARRAQLFSRLDEVSRVLRAGNYNEAETRLRLLLEEYKGEPRVLFALGQTWSAAAADATNEETRDERLNRALANYRLAINAADRETDRPLLSRAYVAAGRILAFLDHTDEAARMFDAAIALGEVADGAYRDAVEERKKLQQP